MYKERDTRPKQDVKYKIDPTVFLKVKPLQPVKMQTL